MRIKKYQMNRIDDFLILFVLKCDFNFQKIRNISYF